jgi:hypothetical protein
MSWDEPIKLKASDVDRDFYLLLDVEDQIDEVHQFLLENSLAYFAKHRLEMQIDELHLQWSELVANNKRVSIQAARDHGKSAFFSYAYPIWQAWRQPKSLGYIMSASIDLAQDLLDIIKFGNKTLPGLYGHPELGYLIGDRERVEAKKKGKVTNVEFSKRQIRLSNGSVIRARGFGSRVRGGHPEWFVCDDVLDESDLYSEIVRAKRRTYFTTAIVNMVLKQGQIIAVGTPFHAEDLYGWLSQNPVYASRVYPGLVDDDQAPLAPDGNRYSALWPERHTVEDLLLKKAEIGSVSFAREILCKPITDDMSLFPGVLFVGDVMAQHVPWGDPEFVRQAGWEVFIGVDLAISASTGADYTVITVLAKDKNGNLYLVDGRRFKGKGFMEQKQAIIDMNQIYLPSVVMIESNLMQRIFGDELIRTTMVPVKKFETTAHSKNSFEQGVPSLRILLENQKLRFARANPVGVRMTQVYIEEMMSFGWINGKLQGAGAHDDCVMSLWLAVTGAQRGGFKFSFGEESDQPAGNVVQMPSNHGDKSASMVDPDANIMASILPFTTG